MGCNCSKHHAKAQFSPHILYCRLPEAGPHSPLLENVDLKKLSRLIRSGRLAPLYPHDLSTKGLEVLEECPICTVCFPTMNTASCCSARICTECFVYHQTASNPPGQAQCPFCKSTPFSVRYLGRKPDEQRRREKLDERIWLEAKRRRGRQQDSAAAAASTTAAAAQQSTAAATGDVLVISSNSTLPGQQQQQEQPQLQQQQETHYSNWLEQLSSPRSSRRVENINVYAGYSQGPAADVSTLFDTTTQQSAATTTTTTTITGAAAAGTGAEASADQQHDEQQQQEHAAAAAAAAVQHVGQLRLQQLSELLDLSNAGLLPRYAAEELSELRLEELDEILVEQALIASMQDWQPATAAAAAAVQENGDIVLSQA